jgi:hypothetical protein
MPKLLREPLLHFLILGAALFLAFEVTQEEAGPGERTIVVTAGQVEQLAGQFSRTWLRPPTARELDGLIEKYIRGEVLYREAQGLGLDRDDPYIRNRLALKLETLLDDLSAGAEPADEELARFLAEHAERFAEPERLSFRQVYVSSERSADPAAEAQRVLKLLQDGQDPDRFGDVSMLAARFDGASPADVERVFGGDFVDALAEVEPGAWHGPVRSPFGLHLVRIAERLPAQLPALEQIRDAVLAEWLDQQRREAREQAYARLRERYKVIIEPATPDGQATLESG